MSLSTRFRRPVTGLLAIGAMIACSAEEETPFEPGAEPTLVALSVTAASTAPLSAVGATVQFSAEGVNSQGAQVQVEVTWSSSDPTIADVDESGLVTARADGSATISAIVGGVTGGAGVVVAQEAARLAFAGEPRTAVEGQPFSEPVAVHVLDANDHLVVNHLAPVALSLIDPNATATLAGPVVQSPVEGVARFDGLSVDQDGTGFLLDAESAGLRAQSSTFEVTRAPVQFTTFQAASFVLGAPDATTLSIPSFPDDPSNFRFPGGVGADAGPLYVPDLVFKRILGYRQRPGEDGARPDFVLGAPDLSSSGPGTTSASTYASPIAAAVSGGKLFVVDSQAHRVLIWNSLPTSDTPADVVVGQSDFVSADPGTTVTSLFQPRDIAVAGDRMVVADLTNNRVLLWNQIPSASGEPADLVLNQDDFTSAAQGVSSGRVRGPRGVWTDGERILVTAANGVLAWTSWPTENGQRPDFEVARWDSFSDTIPGPGSLRFPEGVASDGNFVFVSDTGHHRVLVYRFPQADREGPIAVLGQTDFSLVAPNDPDQDGVENTGVVSARTFESPRHLRLVDGHLFVSDLFNGRVMAFDLGG